MAVGSATIATLALAGLIVLYNAWHKNNPISPLIMGLCRVMVYISCALAVGGQIGLPVLIGSAITLSYLIGLTYTAKQERFGHVRHLWPLACLAAPVLFGLFVVKDQWPLLTVVVLLCVWIAHCLHRILRRQPGDIPTAVVRLIAGISLIDTLLMLSASGISSSGDLIAHTNLLLAAFGLGSFALTLVLQRYVAGT